MLTESLCTADFLFSFFLMSISVCYDTMASSAVAIIPLTIKRSLTECLSNADSCVSLTAAILNPNGK